MDFDNIKELVDKFFNGQYSVEKFLGEGSFARVYRVKHNFLNDRRAMKIIKQPLGPSSNIDKVFYEVMIATRLRGENILSIYDAGIITTYGLDNDDKFILDDKNTGITDKWAYFVLEYVHGGDLEDYRQSFINSDVTMPIFQVLDIIRQILLGLDVLHSSNPPIIHRDIKTSNILLKYDVNSNLQVKISDFGFAKEVTSDITDGDFGGTKLYMSPESFKRISTTSSDVYAVGVIFYLLLTNHYPVNLSKLSLEELQKDTFWNKTIISPSQYNKNIPVLLDEIILKSLDFNPNNRYSNAKEFLDALDDAMNILKDNKNSYFDQSIFQSTSKYNKYKKLNINDNIDVIFKKAQTPGCLDEAIELLEQEIIRDYNTRINYTPILKIWKSENNDIKLINEAFKITLMAENYKLASTFIKEAIAINPSYKENYSHYIQIWELLGKLDQDEKLHEAVESLCNLIKEDKRIYYIYQDVIDTLKTCDMDIMLREALRLVDDDMQIEASLIMEFILLKDKKYKPQYSYKLSLWKQEIDM